MSRVTKVENDESVTIPFSKGSFWRALVVSQLSVHSPEGGTDGASRE